MIESVALNVYNGAMEIGDQILLIKHLARKTLTRDRYKHSKRVAKLCCKLCKNYGLDALRGKLCGIAHDFCKGMDGEELVKLASRDGQGFNQIEQEKKDLLHGRAAAIVMRERFQIEDEEVCQAIANHTFGRPGMSDLAKVLFIADKIEPGRGYVTKARRRELMKLSLNALTALVLKENIDYVKSKHYVVSPVSYEFFKSLEDAGEKVFDKQTLKGAIDQTLLKSETKESSSMGKVSSTALRDATKTAGNLTGKASEGKTGESEAIKVGDGDKNKAGCRKSNKLVTAKVGKDKEGATGESDKSANKPYDCGMNKTATDKVRVKVMAKKGAEVAIKAGDKIIKAGGGDEK